MKRIDLFTIILLALLPISITTSAQEIRFEAVVPPLPAPQNIADFVNVYRGGSAFADIDIDGDLDVLITGMDASSKAVTRLYRNNGTGSFAEDPSASFINLFYSSVEFGDIDNDNDQDVLLTGYSSDNPNYSGLYINDGAGNFTEKNDTPFVGVYNGSTAMADLNNDSYLDIIISGYSASGPVTKLYFTDSTGNYFEDEDAALEAVNFGSIALSDVDGDNDKDLIISGYNLSAQIIAKLYINDGTGSFIEDTETNIEGAKNSSVAFADIDGDSDDDLIIVGQNSSYQKIAKLYANDGSGGFSELLGHPIEPIIDGTVIFRDIDHDNDQDILLAGQNVGNLRIAHLYTNDGTGSFTLVSDTPFEGVIYSSIASADIDSDNDQDLVITGSAGNGDEYSQLYINKGSEGFVKTGGDIFDGVFLSTSDYSDVDLDSDMDIVISGYTTSNEIVTRLYLNDGNGLFNIDASSEIDSLYHSALSFGDIDKDGDEDLVIAGRDENNTYLAKLYLNNGEGIFSEVAGTPFIGVIDGNIVIEDFNGDSFNDILITGATNSSKKTSLYLNDGEGGFTLLASTPFIQVDNSSLAAADIDNDHDVDIVISGMNSSYDMITTVYLNNGSGGFTIKAGTSIIGIRIGSNSFSDVDGDGDSDLFVIGQISTSVRDAKLYLNDGVGNFTESLTSTFDGVEGNGVSFSDVDSDGDNDLLVTGNHNNMASASLYVNDGSGTFSKERFYGSNFHAVRSGSLSFFDMDGDEDDDVLITGQDMTGRRTARIYRNTSCYPSEAQISETACDSYVAPDGNVYNESGQYIAIISNKSGCDSTITIDLTILESTHNTISEVICDTYTALDGEIYTETGQYTAVISNAAGCDSVITIDLTILESTSSEISETACDTYTAPDGEVYNTSGQYTAIIGNLAGCDSTISIDLTINTVNTTVTADGIALTAGAAGAEYKWLNCDDNSMIAGASDQVFTATANGNYAVEVTENGCSDTSECVSITAVNVKENTLDESILLYPNPTSGELNLEISNDNLSDYEVTIRDITGVMIRKENFNSSSFRLEIPGGSGVYIVEVGKGNEKAVLRVLKQ